MTFMEKIPAQDHHPRSHPMRDFFIILMISDQTERYSYDHEGYLHAQDRTGYFDDRGQKMAELIAADLRQH